MGHTPLSRAGPFTNFTFNFTLIGWIASSSAAVPPALFRCLYRKNCRQDAGATKPKSILSRTCKCSSLPHKILMSCDGKQRLIVRIHRTNWTVLADAHSLEV
jgi:hypothetical protein